MTLLSPASVQAAAASDQLPDLRMLKPRDVRIVRYTSGPFQGHRLLRFSTLISNEGAGPLELRGRALLRVTDRLPHDDGSATDQADGWHLAHHPDHGADAVRGR